MPKLLRRTKFGNPILREKARHLSTEEILSEEIQTLIANMRYTVEQKAYGVGLAAQQVGTSVALSIIAIKPTPTRPNRERFEQVIINPQIVETYGKPEPMWEGCISCGSGSDTLYALVPRYKKVKLRWIDESGEQQERVLDDLQAHVAQHETDHTNGILFVDRVVDAKSYMSGSEYRKRVVGKLKNE